MASQFDDIARKAAALPLKQKAALVRLLIEDLGNSVYADADQLWIDEAQRRYEAFLKGELEALPGDEVMDRGRGRLKMIR